ncbi:MULTISPECIES: hypothetical protein [Asticcacaulis]|uniref:hypothetical protein n=1 Tax=Asticcacaulis TaxID=76890 RepID=UPI001FDA8445|nr:MULTISPECIES: hypothetical protein [Asticcacaulis]MBP2158062.1 hypothetical protein [Asticcacaulis solisilvae]MDR6799107.1 hypothetical protein [Asticcacaulis sp. BE141]
MPKAVTHHPEVNDDNAVLKRTHKGRGAASNRPSQRFHAADRYDVHDGWDDGWTHEDRRQLERRKTTLSIDTARSIISRNTSPDVGFSQSINRTGVANMAASTVSPGRATRSSTCRQGSTSKHASSASPMLRNCCAKN